MKTKLDLLTKLHYELNLDNFFNVEFNETKLYLLGFHTNELEVLLFNKNYQVQWDKVREKYIYDSDNLKIVLSDR